MALTNEQYENIMRSYDEVRSANRAQLEARRQRVRLHVPAYADLEDRAGRECMLALRSQLTSGQPADSGGMRARLEAISGEKRRLLQAHGYPEDYLDETFGCPECRDTGFTPDGQKCRCFRLKEIALLYDQSHLSELVRTNNFSLLSEEYREGEDLQRLRDAAAVCRRFAEQFDAQYENLYLYGTVGTGKTFLSICTADELIRSGHAVLYFSASALFDRIARYAFDSRDREAAGAFFEDLCEAELLVIDDLGTELTNAFIAARLFALLNERHLRRRSTIISTNLLLEDLQPRYSDRVFSRIASNYRLLKLTGPDLRLMKKRTRNRK